jgi:hypothetical protein
MVGSRDNIKHIAKPITRPLRIYAFDPTGGRYVDNVMTAKVPYEQLAPGPVGERFAVVDYDHAQETYYAPVDLDDPRIIMRSGLDPSESDPRFHQQMVYAVASETLQRFERALGRRIHWARFSPHSNPAPPGPSRRGHQTTPESDKELSVAAVEAAPEAAPAKKPEAKGPHLLCLFPHAMAQANAFYSRSAQGILFGYFRANETNAGANLPGQIVFSCLSHDIIAHETTHAILDGMRSFFTEPTNVDVVAFHEAFADLSALFSHFSHREVLIDTLSRTGGRLFDTNLRSEAAPLAEEGVDPGAPLLQTQIAQVNPLAQLAQQFGEAMGMNGGLRSMLGVPPDSKAIDKLIEPHARGAILVAAVFDAFITVYTRRTADLFRIYRAGGGSASAADLPDPLVERLADEATRTAEEFFALCAQAIDYCPPVDIVFGDFLRAVLTSHADLLPDDPDHVRSAFLEAFRLRGILPRDAFSLTVSSVCWPRTTPGRLPPVEGLIFGDTRGMTRDEQDKNGDLMRAYAARNAQLLGFAPDHGPIAAPSFHTLFRMAADGTLVVQMVVELVETRIERGDAAVGPYPFRCGVTLIILQGELTGIHRPQPEIQYVIPKLRSEERERRQQVHFAMMQRTGRSDEQAHLAPGADDHAIAEAWQIDFGLIHARQ